MDALEGKYGGAWKGAPLLNVKRILLPLDLVDKAVPVAAVRQTTMLARHFSSEILLLHVVKPLTYMGSGDTVRELLEQAVRNEQEKLKSSLDAELDAIVVKRIVLKGDPAREILRAARDENCDLIVMPTHGYGPLEGLLIGSVTAKVLHESECPVWTGSHGNDVPAEPFAIRNILAAVDFSAHSHKTVGWARDMAAEFGAELTLAHLTPGVEIYGPGGRHVLSEMKRELIDAATKRMDKVRQESGTKAKMYIGSGEVPKAMAQAAEETRADLIVVGCRSSLGGRLGTTAYGIIRQSRVPVVSV